MTDLNHQFYELIQRASFLKDVPLFHHFSSEILAGLAEITSLVLLPRGRILFRQGEFPDSLYIIQSGEIEIKINGQFIALLGRYECLGELSILDESLRSATAEAKTDASLIQILAKDFKTLVAGHSQLSLGLMRTLAQRLRQREAEGRCQHSNSH